MSRIVSSRVEVDDPSILDISLGSGTITRMTAAAGEVVSFTPGMTAPVVVNESPTTVLAGEVPMWRDLRRGDAGEDVRQLQSFLLEAGYALGKADGQFGPATQAAVEAWREDAGLPEGQSVYQHDALFLPVVTKRIRVGEGLRVGQSVSGDEVVLQLLHDSPRLFIDLPRELSGEVSIGDRVVMADHRCELSVAGFGEAAQQFDAVRVELEPDARSRSACSDVSSGPETRSASFAAEILVVPLEEGPLVPTSAIRIGDGRAQVELADGTVADVRIRATDGATAIVDGVDPGDRVVIQRAE